MSGTKAGQQGNIGAIVESGSAEPFTVHLFLVPSGQTGPALQLHAAFNVITMLTQALQLSARDDVVVL